MERIAPDHNLLNNALLRCCYGDCIALGGRLRVSEQGKRALRSSLVEAAEANCEGGGGSDSIKKANAQRCGAGMRGVAFVNFGRWFHEESKLQEDRARSG